MIFHKLIYIYILDVSNEGDIETKKKHFILLLISFVYCDVMCGLLLDHHCSRCCKKGRHAKYEYKYSTLG